jgi:TonB family protein
MRSRTRTIAAAAAGLALAVAAITASIVHSRYFPERELDRRPYPMRRVDVDFPAARTGLEYYGRIKIHVFINAQGAVDKVEVAGSAVPAALRDAAVRAFAQTRWEPGRKWGVRVNALKVVEVDFEPPLPGLDRPLSPDQ